MRQTIVLFSIVVIASSVGNLSQTGLNAMLTSVCADFGIAETLGQWLSTLYMLMLGIVVPLATYLMGRFRLKDLTQASIIIFCVGSFVCALAPGFAVLLAGRLMQAVSAGVLLPLVQTVAMVRFPEGRKATAMGVAGIAMGFAPNIGPTIGGAMVEGLGWRSFFWLVLALGLACAVVCQFAVKRREDASYPADFDVLSFVLSAVGFCGLLAGASEASSVSSFASPRIWAPVIVGAAFLALFVRRQKRLECPLIDMAIFKEESFVVGFWALNFLFASFMGITLLIPLYIEGLCGGDSMLAGMALLPGTIAALIMNPLAGVLVDKIGVRPVCLFGGAFLAVGASLMAIFCDANTPFWLTCAMQGVRAAGVSTLIGPLTTYSLSRLSGRRVSDGSGFGAAVRQACASIGMAGMVFFAASGVFAGEAAFHAAFAFSAFFAIVCFGTIVAKVR